MKVRRSHNLKMHGKNRIFGSVLKKHVPAGLRRKSLSELEDSQNAILVLARIGREAAKYAAEEAKSAGLSRIYARNNELEKISASGRRQIILPKHKRAYFVKYKPDTIFHAVKK